MLLCARTCTRLLVCVGCADLITLDTMTPQERKRQGYIHELIHTEETYVEDLELVLEVGADTEGGNPGFTFQLSPCQPGLLQAHVGVRPPDRGGDGSDLRQLEGANNVQHQVTQVGSKHQLG